MKKLLLFSASFFVFSAFTALYAQKTSVHGQILDDKGESIPFATIQIPETNQGDRADIDGFFLLESTKPFSSITVRNIGFASQVIAVKPKQHTELKIQLVSETKELKEVVVKAGKLKKDQAAFDLVEEVFKRKDANRKEGLDFYSYQAYEKIEFDLNNITDKFRNRKSFRKFQFVFENVDTNRVNGKVALPVFIRERILDNYYRKTPHDEKEYLLAEKQAGLKGYIDGDGVSAYLNSLYQKINIYDPTVSLFSAQLTGPLSNIGPNIYRFYILDTVQYRGIQCADVFFAPRNKNDLAFMGNMLVALDGSYAVRRIQMGISKDINLNFIQNLTIDQEFDFIADGENKRLMLVTDQLEMEVRPLDVARGRSMVGKKTVSYKDYTLNKSLPDSLFAPAIGTVLVAGYKKRDTAYWTDMRHTELSKTEIGIYKMIDTIQTVPAFKRTAEVMNLLLVGYKTIGFWDLGPVNTFYSFNQVEGFRGRIGGRTNPKLAKNFFFEGFVAHGFRDQVTKYFAGGTYAFKHQRPLAFPMNQVTVSHQYDTNFPGEELQFIQDDNALLSIRRGVNDKMFYTRTSNIDYTREINAGVRYNVVAQHVEIVPGGNFKFFYNDATTGERKVQRDITTTQFGASVRWAPNEKFYQGKTERSPIATKYPVMTMFYRGGFKVLDGDYKFHNFAFQAKKYFYMNPIGFSDVTLEGGYIFGKLPYQLLEIHRANQSYSYQLPSYNLMNFLEFVSDRYVGLNVQHQFGGFFLNRVPLVKKLKWREVISFKGLYGGLRDENRPNGTNGLIEFPTETVNGGRIIMNTLESKPYIEVSAGLSNIFKIFRVDYVRRVNYLDLPGVSKWGIRARFKIDF
jgi:Family of unknown function (DUF5686)/CarboxypepD_reg-like domain